MSLFSTGTIQAGQTSHRVRFTTAAALVSELIEARDDKHLLRFQKLLTSYELLIVDELGYVPLSRRDVVYLMGWSAALPQRMWGYKRPKEDRFHGVA